MSVAAKSPEPAPLTVDLYRVRDDLAEHYNPANAFERMLLSQIAQSWLRLQRAQDAEARYFQSHDVLDAIATDYKTYRAVTRHVAECNQAWRSAKWQLEKAQSSRKRINTSSPNARRHPVTLPSTIHLASADTAHREPVATAEIKRPDEPVTTASG